MKQTVLAMAPWGQDFTNIPTSPFNSQLLASQKKDTVEDISSPVEVAMRPIAIPGAAIPSFSVISGIDTDLFKAASVPTVNPEPEPTPLAEIHNFQERTDKTEQTIPNPIPVDHLAATKIERDKLTTISQIAEEAIPKRSVSSIDDTREPTEEVELRPGESRELKLRVQDASRYVGIYGAYRNLGGSQWRQVIQLRPAALAQIRLDFTADGIQAAPPIKE